MQKNNHRLLKLSLIFSFIISFVITITMLIVGIIIFILYCTGHLDESDSLFLVIWFLLPNLIAGIAISFLVAIKGLRPILKMSDAIARVAEGDFSVRFEEKHLIKEISQMAECFNIMTEKLNNINTLHNDFISNAAHEFRTPLSVIEGYAELLEKEQVSNIERIQYANQINRVTNKLSAVVNNILYLSKIDVKDIKFEKELFNLSESIREVLIMLESKWTAKGIFVDLELQDYLYLGNKEMLEEVWNNLISNAIKFSDVGGRLKIATLQNEDIATIVITDNGIGMTKETQKKIYDKFFQVETSRSLEGAGLGLSIVKRIIDLHQGKIYVDSELNQGTTFTIDLPMERQ